MPLDLWRSFAQIEGTFKQKPTESQGMGRRKRNSMRWDPEMNKKHKELFKNKPPQYIALDALVTSKPRHECSIFGNEYRAEVVVTGILYNGNSADSYLIRFVHKHCLESAGKLTYGTRIRIEKGRYEYRKGRLGAEFQVKYFSLKETHSNNYGLLLPAYLYVPDFILAGRWQLQVSF